MRLLPYPPTRAEETFPLPYRSLPRAVPRRTLLPRDEGGFIVFGCLLLIVVVFVSAVLIGKLIHGPERTVLTNEGREVRHAVSDVPVTYGPRVMKRLKRGDSAWVAPVEGGEVAVYEDGEDLNVIGFAPDSLFRKK